MRRASFVDRSRGEFSSDGKEERKMHRMINICYLPVLVGPYWKKKTIDRLLLSLGLHRSSEIKVALNRLFLQTLLNSPEDRLNRPKSQKRTAT